MRYSLLRLFCCLLLWLICLSPALLNAQVFQEDFEGGVLPPGWTTFDGDGQMPNSNVGYFTSAWIVREDFDVAGDTAAMSVSWYFPLTGPSDDWLITPRINIPPNTELRWDGESQDANFPESYEVRASAASAALPVSNFSTLLSAVNGESGAVATQHTASLSGVPGSHYLAWRNTSFDQFILVIDNIEIRTVLNEDVAMVHADRPEFTILPESQATSIPLAGRIQNVGLDSASSVSMTVNVYDGSFTQLYTSTSNTQALGIGSTANLSVPNFVPSGPDFYTFEYIANRNGNDQDRNNDTLYWTLQISDSIMARDDGIINSTLGIGAGNGGVMGQTFILTAPEYLNSVTCYMNVSDGQSYFAEIWDFSGTPSSVLARTDTFFATKDTGLFLTLPLSGGAILMPADTFFVGFQEPDSALEIGYSMNLFTGGSTFLDWPTNPFMTWSNNEAFGFDVTYVMRANLTLPCPAYNLTATIQNASCNNSDGMASVNVGGGSGPFTYAWSNGQTVPTAVNLAAGQYTVVVSDTNNCRDSLLVTVNNLGAPAIDSLTATELTCFGDSSGTAAVHPSGGLPPYQYAWSNGDTTANISGLVAGAYTVTITDAGNCLAIQSVLVPEPMPVQPQVNAINASCGTCSDGSAMVSPSGGTPPYSQVWSTSSSNSTIANLLPGAYSVTVTDARGCTGIDTFNVGIATGLDAGKGSAVKLFPNPSNGAFQLHIAHPYPAEMQVSIFDAQGRLTWQMAQSGLSSLMRNFDIRDLAPGSYLVQVRIDDAIQVRKLVIY